MATGAVSGLGFNRAAPRVARRSSGSRVRAASQSCFNGAAGITPRRERARHGVALLSRAGLQWGRGNYPAESVYG